MSANDAEEAPQQELNAEPQPLATPEQAKLANFERRIKLTTVIIATLALIASASSAAAAVSSWRTASATAQLAREVARTSGAYLKVSSMVGISGACGNPADPMVVIAEVENQGRIAGRIKSLVLLVDTWDRMALPCWASIRLHTEWSLKAIVSIPRSLPLFVVGEEGVKVESPQRSEENRP